VILLRIFLGGIGRHATPDVLLTSMNFDDTRSFSSGTDGLLIPLFLLEHDHDSTTDLHNICTSKCLPLQSAFALASPQASLSGALLQRLNLLTNHHLKPVTIFFIHDHTSVLSTRGSYDSTMLSRRWATRLPAFLVRRDSWSTWPLPRSRSTKQYFVSHFTGPSRT